MGEGKGSTLVFVLVIALCLVAFGFSIAAERRRSIVNRSSLSLSHFVSPNYGFNYLDELYFDFEARYNL